MITQWVVVAIRNLCQDNVENQDVVAKLDKKGQMNKDLLKESGLDIHGLD